MPEQYVRYLREIARGNLGESFALHRPVADALAEALPNTLTLAGAALCIEFVLGLALGVYQAARARRFGDVALGNATLFLYSVPTFWLGLLLLVVFGQWLRWFPVGGVVDVVTHESLPWAGRVADRLWHLALPAATLCGANRKTAGASWLSSSMACRQVRCVAARRPAPALARSTSPSNAGLT